jgi:hypothetical protein
LIINTVFVGVQARRDLMGRRKRNLNLGGFGAEYKLFTTGGRFFIKASNKTGRQR